MSRPHRSPYLIFTIIAVPLIIALVIILALITDLAFYWIWLIALSIITFLLYGYDKGQAKLGGLRVPERTESPHLKLQGVNSAL